MSVLNDIREERVFQDKKWGEQNHTIEKWMLILSEEFGEAAKEANECVFRFKSSLDYRKELVQVAAVCVAALEALDRGYR